MPTRETSPQLTSPITAQSEAFGLGKEAPQQDHSQVDHRPIPLADQREQENEHFSPDPLRSTDRYQLANPYYLHL